MIIYFILIINNHYKPYHIVIKVTECKALINLDIIILGLFESLDVICELCVQNNK